MWDVTVTQHTPFEGSKIKYMNNVIRYYSWIAHLKLHASNCWYCCSDYNNLFFSLYMLAFKKINKLKNNVNFYWKWQWFKTAQLVVQRGIYVRSVGLSGQGRDANVESDSKNHLRNIISRSLLHIINNISVLIIC